MPLSLSTLADRVGAICMATLRLFRRLEAHVLAAERLHGDDTTVPVLAASKTDVARIWDYVGDDRPFGAPAPPAAIFYYSRDRRGEHPQAHVAAWSGVLQADAYGGYNKLYEPGCSPAPITQALCWSHGRRHFYELADVAESARRSARGKPAIISPIAPEAVRRIELIFDIEREINGRPAATRLAARQAYSRPLIDDLEAWMREQRARLSRHDPVAKARLHAGPLGGVHPLPGRRPGLPHEQRCRTRLERIGARTQVMAVLRLRPGRSPCGADVQPDRHLQDERRRPASLARRRARTHRRPPCPTARRSPTLELESRARSSYPSRLIRQAELSAT